MTTCAALAVWLSAAPWWLACPVIAVCFGLAWRTRQQWARIPVRAAGWTPQQGWSLRLASGEDVSATLASFRVVSNRAIWLFLRSPGQGLFALLLAPDNSDADIRRRLRMRLAMADQAGGSSSGVNRGTPDAKRGPTV